MQAVSEAGHWMLRLSPGEELIEAITELARANEIHAAAVPMGIGQLTSAEFGFWNGAQYERHTVEETVELVGLSGSIAVSDGRPSVHLHAVVGTRALRTLSGHLFRGVVGVLAEVSVTPFPSRGWERPMDELIGLRILDLAPDATAR